MSKSNKNKAVALKYNVDEDMTPVVIASGYGKIAERIIDIAELKGIPVYRDDSAASLMCMLDVGNNIPKELYDVVAAIYGQIMKTSAEIKDNQEKPIETDTLQERQSSFLKKRSTLKQDIKNSLNSQKNEIEQTNQDNDDNIDL